MITFPKPSRFKFEFRKLRQKQCGTELKSELSWRGSSSFISCDVSCQKGTESSRWSSYNASRQLQSESNLEICAPWFVRRGFCHQFQSVRGGYTILKQLNSRISSCIVYWLATATASKLKCRSSPGVRDIHEYPEVEIIRNPPEWKYVEGLFPPPTVPAPPKQGDNFASGGKPPRKYDPQTDAFFVRLNKNQLIPVYIPKVYRGTRQVTVVRSIIGDIWSLEMDIRKVIEKSQDGNVCASRVNEMTGQLTFHGDYVDLLLNYLQEQGY